MSPGDGGVCRRTGVLVHYGANLSVDGDERLNRPRGTLNRARPGGRSVAWKADVWLRLEEESEGAGFIKQ